MIGAIWVTHLDTGQGCNQLFFEAGRLVDFGDLAEGDIGPRESEDTDAELVGRDLCLKRVDEE